jgi:hypothetical protein
MSECCCRLQTVAGSVEHYQLVAGCLSIHQTK